MQEVACSVFSSVYEIIPMNLHVSLHTTLLTSRLCKETYNQCQVGLLQQNGTSSGRHAPIFFERGRERGGA
jgi:hypothetical protein